MTWWQRVSRDEKSFKILAFLHQKYQFWNSTTCVGTDIGLGTQPSELMKTKYSGLGVSDLWELCKFELLHVVG